MSDEKKPTFPVTICGIWHQTSACPFDSPLKVNKNDQITFENVEAGEEIKTLYSETDKYNDYHLWTVKKNGTLRLQATHRSAKKEGEKSTVKPVLKKKTTVKKKKRRSKK
mmetsp:Transcript_4738/g.7115  ORF Transcript_4738/g.7115 Transcript_4738/m.7115 type:complete len:110 (+) Transcript_4738:30-359(+)